MSRSRLAVCSQLGLALGESRGSAYPLRFAAQRSRPLAGYPGRSTRLAGAIDRDLCATYRALTYFQLGKKLVHAAID
jgi:hypothetical protein